MLGGGGPLGPGAGFRCQRLGRFGRSGGLGVALGNERVRLIGDLGKGEQVVEAEALRGLPLALVAVETREGDVVPGESADLVFPNGRLDGSGPDFCDGLCFVGSPLVSGYKSNRFS